MKIIQRLDIVVLIMISGVPFFVSCPCLNHLIVEETRKTFTIPIIWDDSTFYWIFSTTQYIHVMLIIVITTRYRNMRLLDV